VNHNFAVDNTTLAPNQKFAAGHTIWQQMLIRYRQLSFGNESQFCCRQYNFGSESQIHCRTHNSAVNANSLQTTQFRHRITISLYTIQLRQWIINSPEHTIWHRMLICCRQLNFDSESQIDCRKRCRRRFRNWHQKLRRSRFRNRQRRWSHFFL